MKILSGMSMMYVMDYRRKKYVDHIGKLLHSISAMLFPARNSLDFRQIKPEELLKNLPRSRNLSGATAVTDRQKISAVLSYKNTTTRSLVWSIKYTRDKYALTCVGYILYRALMEIISTNESETRNGQPFIIIPMPISHARRRERGYNQCELLAKAILHCDTEGIFDMRTDILFKIKNVKKQTFKNRQERLTSIHGVFRVDMPTDIRDSRLFLLDDVITTGSTMQSAMTCLYQAGFKNVYGISLAH